MRALCAALYARDTAPGLLCSSRAQSRDAIGVLRARVAAARSIEAIGSNQMPRSDHCRRRDPITPLADMEDIAAAITNHTGSGQVGAFWRRGSQRLSRSPGGLFLPLTRFYKGLKLPAIAPLRFALAAHNMDAANAGQYSIGIKVTYWSERIRR